MLVRLILAVLWTAFIVYALISSPSGVPKYWWLGLPGMDKFIHAILFGVEGFLVVWFLLNRKLQRAMLWSIAWCVFLGGGLEVVQFQFVPDRNGDLLDLVADAFGAVVAVVGFVQIRKKIGHYYGT